MSGADGLPIGARRFADDEPSGDFAWLFRNRDGTVSEYPTTLAEYLTFRARYGVPETWWRPR